MKRTAVVVTVVLGLWASGAPAKDPPGPPRDRPREDGKKYSIEQACSDRAQTNTIAFDALAFLTGNLGSCTFLPPGKVSDYFGFQYMRDIDTGAGGHNTDFLTNIANNVWLALNEKQRAQMIALAREQAGPIRELARKRFPLIKAFRRQLDGDIPAGSKGLDRDAVKKCAADLFELDGRLAFQRARALGGIARSLDARQKADLGKLVFGNSKTWPAMEEQVDKRGFTHEEHVALMTYASEFFSWYAGSVEADVYFCPERHGTYFGSFYMKDAPAMGKKGYSISTALTGDKGEAFLAALTPAQRELITGLVDLQRKDLTEIVKTRRAVAVELRRFMKDDSADEKAVLALARKYGELDGEIAFLYATRFAQVNATLSDAQRQNLMKLRDLDAFPCKGAYLYSDPIDMPSIPDTDFLFGVPNK